MRPLWNSKNFKQQSSVDNSRGKDTIQTDLLVVNNQNNKRYDILKEDKV